MKNLRSIFTFTTVIYLSITIGKYFSKGLNGNTSNDLNDSEDKNGVEKQYDLSLRNFHPNKGE